MLETKIDHFNLPLQRGGITIKKNLMRTLSEYRIATIPWRLLLSFFFIIYLPSLVFVTFGQSSLAPGIGAAILISSILCIKRSYFSLNRREFSIGIASFSAIVILSFLSLFLNQNVKSLTALALIPVVIGGYIIHRRISETDADLITVSLTIVSVITLAIGWLGLFDITKVGEYSSRVKAVAPFSEESHYALSLAMVSLPSVLFGRFKVSILILLNVLAQAILFPSLTLLLFFGIAIAALAIRTIGARILLATPVAIVLIIYSNNYIQSSEYFSSRLSFTDSNNLTNLVWMQGWGLLLQGISSNYGLGLGIQALGLGSTRFTEQTYRIEQISQGHLNNFTDGGFLAAKLGAELGIVGVFISLLLTALTLRFITSLREKNITHDTIYGAIFLSFLVELFFRGYGYFSPGVIMITAGLFNFFSKRNQM